MNKWFIILVIAILSCSCSGSKKMVGPKTAITMPSTETGSVAAVTPDHDGSSYEKAIIMSEKHESEGVKAEYTLVKRYYPGYKLKQQSMNFHKERKYDILDIITSDGLEKSIYFDISNFYGKL